VTWSPARGLTRANVQAALFTRKDTRDAVLRLARLLIYGERHLRKVLAEYQRHYNYHRPHRARHLRPSQPPPRPVTSVDFDPVRLQSQEVLDGLIGEYKRAT
jgi:hypothetical protein